MIMKIYKNYLLM